MPEYADGVCFPFTMPLTPIGLCGSTRCQPCTAILAHCPAPVAAAAAAAAGCDGCKCMTCWCTSPAPLCLLQTASCPQRRTWFCQPTVQACNCMPLLVKDDHCRYRSTCWPTRSHLRIHASPLVHHGCCIAHCPVKRAVAGINPDVPVSDRLLPTHPGC